MNLQNPTLQSYLPELRIFLKKLTEDYRTGALASWGALVSQVENFFTPGKQVEIERVLSGWHEMADYQNGITQVHTIGVLVAIMTSPEYQAATKNQKEMLEWSGLLHDISKRAVPGRSDLTHAFRSAAKAARVLIQAGFSYQETADLESWIALTNNAVLEHDGREIQDNQKLPEIMAGLDVIFSGNQVALVILKAILFHWSFTTIQEWPCAAPLTPDQIKEYLDKETLQVLGPLILADSDSWNLFDHPNKERYRFEVSSAIVEIEVLLG